MAERVDITGDNGLWAERPTVKDEWDLRQAEGLEAYDVFTSNGQGDQSATDVIDSLGSNGEAPMSEYLVGVYLDTPDPA